MSLWQLVESLWVLVDACGNCDEISSLLMGTNALFNVPQLADDGSNWITYKERALTHLALEV